MDNIVGNTNSIVHQLLERGATKYTVLVTLFRRSNSIFASFRSRNGDALKMAVKFQGGGHANAAGAILPKSIRTVEDDLRSIGLGLTPENGDGTLGKRHRTKLATLRLVNGRYGPGWPPTVEYDKLTIRSGRRAWEE